MTNNAEPRVPAPRGRPLGPLDVPTGEMPPVDPLEVPTGELPADVPTGELSAADEQPPPEHPSLPGDGDIIVLSDRPRPPEVRHHGVRPGAHRHDWWVDLVDRWFPERYRVPTVVTTAVSLVLTTVFLFLPTLGTDLAGQVARGHYFADNGPFTVDFGWYDGVYAFGNSLLGAPLASILGSRGVGAVSCVVSSAAFAWLLARWRAPRPLIGGVLAAVAGVCNLISGRTTFGLGLALAMLALVAISLPRGAGWFRYALGCLMAVCATVGDPLAGLFVGLAGGALLLSGMHWRGELPTGPTWRRWLGDRFGGHSREGLALLVGALVGMVPMMAFDDGGVEPFTADAMKVFVAVGVATFFLLPRRFTVLRIGAVLLIVALFVVFFVPSPIGSNITRLPMLYSAPLIAAVSTVDARLLVAALVALTWWQPPLNLGDLGQAGDRSAQSGFYQPLIGELQTLGPVGRIEVVPLYEHWEATYVAAAVPLARGGQSQVDVARNHLFYGESLAPDTYLSWLYHNAVSYVAVPNGTRLDQYGTEEANLIGAGLPYLKKVWSNADWTLYGVVGAQQLVTGVGTLVSSTNTGVTFDAKSGGDTTIRVRWSRWLTVAGPEACLMPSKDGWVTVRAADPGRYTISSGWHITQPDRCRRS